MAYIDFGTYGSGARFTDVPPVYSDGIPMPNGRVDSSGAVRAGVVEVLVYTGTTGGNANLQIVVGPNQTGVHVIGYASPATAVGPLPLTSMLFTNGGTSRVSMYFSGASIRFGGGGGGATYNGAGSYWSGTIPGRLYYALPPTAPGSLTVTSSADGTSATLSVTGPGDNGDSAITGYSYQRATNTAFTAGVSTITTSASSTPMTGLTPGATYYYRATARNAVTNTAGVLGGQWTGTVTRTQTNPNGLGRRFNGTTNVEADGKYFNGSSWVALEGRYFNGSSWVALGQ